MKNTDTATKKQHPRPLTQNLFSGKIYCAACLASAETIEALDARPCYADHYDN